MDNPNIFIIILLVCVLPVITMGFMAVVLFSLGRRELNRLVSPNAEVLFQQFQHMVTQNPREDKDVLIQNIINEQAFKCGVIGAIAGIGGFFTLPIALPIDVLLSIRLQAALTQFIASSIFSNSFHHLPVPTQYKFFNNGSSIFGQQTALHKLRCYR